jgi:hypothetical protein
LSDSSKKDKTKKPKRKINWSEYNECLVRRGEMLFDSSFFTELASRAKENERRKGRSSLSISELLDIAARHRTCVPTSIPTIRRLSKDDVNPYKEIKTDSTRFYNNLVESRKNEGEPEPPKSKSIRKRRRSDSS